MIYFQTKNPKFGRPRDDKFWYISCPFGIFKVICLIVLPIGTFCGHLANFLPFYLQCCTKKNLATLIHVSQLERSSAAQVASRKSRQSRKSRRTR
jgi:hypothetical protein